MKAKVTIEVAHETWQGEVLAYTGGYLRVSLAGRCDADWPQWDAATCARCVLQEGDQHYISDGTILKQDKDLVWVQVPPTWSGADRRSTARQLGGFRVQFESQGRACLADCVDISASGIRLRTLAPPPEKSRLRLNFRLPTDGRPISVEGIVLRAQAGEDAAEVGVKFAHTGLLDSVRIATYCYV